jgi:hypothetical protein
MPRLTGVTLTLLAKPGCHLCEDLRALLDDLRPDYGYDIEEVDITTRAELFDEHRHRIPVLLKAGAELASGPVGESRLVAILEACAAAE